MLDRLRSQLERRLAELPPDQEIIAYCRGPWCVLSFEAVALLRRRLEDGFPEWKTAGLPIDSPYRDRPDEFAVRSGAADCRGP